MDPVAYQASPKVPEGTRRAAILLAVFTTALLLVSTAGFVSWEWYQHGFLPPGDYECSLGDAFELLILGGLASIIIAALAVATTVVGWRISPIRWVGVVLLILAALPPLAWMET